MGALERRIRMACLCYAGLMISWAILATLKLAPDTNKVPKSYRIVAMAELGIAVLLGTGALRATCRKAALWASLVFAGFLFGTTLLPARLHASWFGDCRCFGVIDSSMPARQIVSSLLILMGAIAQSHASVVAHPSKQGGACA